MVGSGVSPVDLVSIPSVNFELRIISFEDQVDRKVCKLLDKSFENLFFVCIIESGKTHMK